MDETPKCETGNHQNPRGEYRKQPLCDLSWRKFLLDTSPEAEGKKAKMNYWDLIKIKSFCTVREKSTKPKGKLWNGRRYLQMTYLVKG